MELRQILIDGCKEINVNLDESQVNQFIIFKDLLLEWNQKVNLTAITEEKDIMVKHFIDSLTPLKHIDLNGKKIIDVGTGAGFPGIPLKIACKDCNLTLLDSLNKRIMFLEEVKKRLKLEKTEIIHGRAEDYGINKEYREKHDYCISRAVASLSALCEYCLPFVKVGGYFISLKGPKGDEELTEAKRAISLMGGTFEKIEKIKLPFEDISHSIIFIKKIKQTPTNYPRKAGKPSKDPIK